MQNRKCAIKRKYVAAEASKAYHHIFNHEQIKDLQQHLNITEYEMDILNANHVCDCIELLAIGFAKGGGSYEVIKNLEPSDLIPIATSWVHMAVKAGLSFIIKRKDNNEIVYVGIHEVIGYDQNVSHHLKLSKNGKLRQQIRLQFERNDPFWQHLLALKAQNRLKYGEALAGIGAIKSGFQRRSIVMFAQYIWNCFWREMHCRGILRYFVKDPTHWKAIKYNRYELKVQQRLYGQAFTFETSEFDVNEYVKTLNNDGDFSIEPNIPRKMVMMVLDFDAPLSRNVSWKRDLSKMIAQKKSKL